MDFYIYDNSLQGFFSAVFTIYKNKITDFYITSGSQLQPTFDSKIFNVTTSEEYYQRIKAYILRTCGYEVYRHIKYALASFNPHKNNIVYNFLKTMFTHGKDTPFMLSNLEVAEFFDVSRKVRHECHRMLGFIRLKQCKGDIFYAAFTPDNDVTQFIMPHFVKRFSSQKFILHDTVHNKLGMYEGTKYKVVDFHSKLEVMFTEEEFAFTDLWRIYYNTINIESRKNTKAMKRFMPVRYHKFMSEKDDLVKSLED